jgi:asparagine synthase (glutamine-hydrolysing)
MLASVRKLEPGSALLVHGGKVQRHWTYYSIPYDGHTETAGEPQLAGELVELVGTAVRRQLVADVPVGAFLSGGLDSSAIVAMMRRAVPQQPIRCFTVGFGADVIDGTAPDLPYARRVAAQLGVDLEEVVVEPGAISRLEQMIELLDEPQADPAPINAWMIAERARARGIPVLLSGAGGDDLFGGYRRHWALAFERRWAWLPAGMRGGVQAVAAAAASGRARAQSHPVLRRAAKMLASVDRLRPCSTASRRFPTSMTGCNGCCIWRRVIFSPTTI